MQALRAELDERTKDLQRLSAEYANYRRRVERDRAAVREQATGAVLSELLGVLDALDQAREHGDLVGSFGAVADQLISVLTKLGLTPFAEPGDEFDPTRHEAVMHSLSSEVSGPTCVQVFRRGYMYGERLLRPALVAVAEPSGEQPQAAAAEEAKAAAKDTGDTTQRGSDKDSASTGADAKATADTGNDTEVDAEAATTEAVEGDVVDPEAAAVADEGDGDPPSRRGEKSRPSDSSPG